MSQARLSELAGISPRQVARYEAGEQQPVLSAAVRLASALNISLDQLAGQITYDLDLSGTWWCVWQTRKDGVPRIEVRTLQALQHGDVLRLDAERALPVSEGSCAWRGELRLWDNEALIGWYQSADAAVRSRGSLCLALRQHGTHARGRWAGMSHDGAVITGWVVIARTSEEARDVAQHLVGTAGPHGDTP